MHHHIAIVSVLGKYAMILIEHKDVPQRSNEEQLQ